MNIKANTFIGIDYDINDFEALIKAFDKCPCGEHHTCGVKSINIGSSLVHNVGDILLKNNFPKKILLVADKTTLKVSNGILESLKGFDVETYIYDNLRVAKISDVNMVEDYIDRGIQGVLAVGTGSIHDTCRMACANKKTPLCLFATAPSMDGFASYSAPIVNNCFKITYPAKCPEIIIADTKILANSPKELKSAGFGDMVSKYIALIDWKVSALLTGESYCENVARLTRYAVDRVMEMSDSVTKNDEECAKAIFEGLILTGIAMSFTKTSRPGSGTEHIMAHFIECKELINEITPNFHGEDVGVTTLMILKIYKSVLLVNKISTKKEDIDWGKIEGVYGKLYGEVKKLNTPTTITEDIMPKDIENNFEKIKEIVLSVPSYDIVYKKMKEAGCKLNYKDINKSASLINDALIYHPYMRRRLSLRRIINMTNFDISKFLVK